MDAAFSSIAVSYTHLDVYKRQPLRPRGGRHGNALLLDLLRTGRACGTTRLPPVSYTHLDVYKRQVWEDMLAVMERLDMPISEKQRGYFLPRE